MIWPSRKRRKPTPDQVEALRAKVQADLQLKNAQRSHVNAQHLVDSLREIRKQNHFGETLEGLNWGRKA